MRINKHILRSTTITPSPRVSQVLGLFDVPPTPVSTQDWHVAIDLPDDWHIGVIVGPSGSGKSTVARECFGDAVAGPFDWPHDRSILDGFPIALPIKQVVGLLSSVGFSSPPMWVRPFHVLSNGQQFRVNLARTLAEALVDGKPKLVDEYSSVVDRTVAQIGSAAVARTVRRNNLRFIAVTCHYDVLDWLEPDWVYEPHTGEMQKSQCRTQTEVEGSALPARSAFCVHRSAFDSESATSREDLRRGAYKRPPIELQIIRTDRSAWPRFKPHHYLSGDLHRSAACYVALVNDEPAAFTAVLPFPHPTRSGYREHRTVCLPDYQGVGIGNAMSEFVASLYQATGKPYTSTTSHPAMIQHRAKSPLWRMTRAPSLVDGHAGAIGTMRKRSAVDRLTAGFEYVGPARVDDAVAFGITLSRP